MSDCEDVQEVRWGLVLSKFHGRYNTFFREFHKGAERLFTWTERADDEVRVNAAFAGKDRTIHYFRDSHSIYSPLPRHQVDFDRTICAAHAETADVPKIYGDITVDEHTGEVYQHFGANTQQAQNSKDLDNMVNHTYAEWTRAIEKAANCKSPAKAQYNLFGDKITIGVKVGQTHFMTYLAPKGISLTDALSLLPDRTILQDRPDATWLRHLFGEC